MPIRDTGRAWNEPAPSRIAIEARQARIAEVVAAITAWEEDAWPGGEYPVDWLWELPEWAAAYVDRQAEGAGCT